MILVEGKKATFFPSVSRALEYYLPCMFFHGFFFFFCRLYAIGRFKKCRGKLLGKVRQETSFENLEQKRGPVRSLLIAEHYKHLFHV